MGAAWGAPIAEVEVQIDGGPWRAAELATASRAQARRLRVAVLDLRLGPARPGEHTVPSRAFDVEGNLQPAPDDPFLASK